MFFHGARLNLVSDAELNNRQTAEWSDCMCRPAQVYYVVARHRRVLCRISYNKPAAVV